MGYDNARVYAECAEREIVAVIPLRRNSGIRASRLPRKSDEWRRLYRGRSAVGREFGSLKHHYGLAVLWVRGIERVRLHAEPEVAWPPCADARGRSRDGRLTQQVTRLSVAEHGLPVGNLACMNATGMAKLRAFRDTYVPLGSSVLDVGSWSTGTLSARNVFPNERYGYVGLDIVEGNNVDLTVADAYKWDEVENETFDAVICSNTYEHNPYFWITTAEIARVLKPGGYACILAPSSGGVHRYPLDCWRLCPDATAALAGYTGLEPIELQREATLPEGDVRTAVARPHDDSSEAVAARQPGRVLRATGRNHSDSHRLSATASGCGICHRRVRKSSHLVGRARFSRASRFAVASAEEQGAARQPLVDGRFANPS